jgi:hypothetical protein
LIVKFGEVPLLQQLNAVDYIAFSVICVSVVLECVWKIVFFSQCDVCLFAFGSLLLLERLQRTEISSGCGTVAPPMGNALLKK